MNCRKFFAVVLLAFAILLTNQPVFANFVQVEVSTSVFADKYIRTELYFGLSKPDGGEVSEAEWDKFLETEVTPRFPAGLTVLSGYGQYKDDDTGKIVGEKSRVLILLYPKKDRRASHEKIEQIRTVYIKQFSQKSVLRMDFRQSFSVSF